MKLMLASRQIIDLAKKGFQPAMEDLITCTLTLTFTFTLILTPTLNGGAHPTAL